jgi:hypothetical protein
MSSKKSVQNRPVLTRRRVLRAQRGRVEILCIVRDGACPDPLRHVQARLSVLAGNDARGQSMKLAHTLSVVIGLILTPTAYAQPTCSEFARITSEALEDFDAIIGEEIETDSYKASVWLSGAGECQIDYEWDSIYTCLYQFESYASASAAWDAQHAALGSCLAGWAPTSMTPESEAPDGYRTLSGTRYTGSGDFVDMDWAVILQEHTGTHGTDYHLLVELVYWL